MSGCTATVGVPHDHTRAASVIVGVSILKSSPSAPVLKQTMRQAIVLALLTCTPAFAQKPTAPPTAPQTIAAKTTGMTAMPGLLPLFWDATAGKLYLEIPHLNQDLLYTNSLPYGTGSNDLGLDRGQTSDGKIVRFERTGPKVLLVQPNQAFRSSATDPAELLAVRQSFPESVLAGFTVAAENSPTDVLIDATDFFLRDAHGVVESLTRAQQGTYKLDPARSTIDLTSTKAFPKNTEVEAILTFATDTPSGGRRGSSFVADVTPDPHALTLHEHQSFLELPGPGFNPRRYDPRAGYFPTSYRDYNAPLGAELDQQFIVRHRLNKKDPACRLACEPEAPIQYYVDRGAPEPIRTALLEGARWWDQAFQAAGWAKGTFKVDILPADADPMDVRFNIIQWVHRYTRGWSYGAAVVDPRTGEILKGNVTLGSLRGRQDYLIAEALLSPYVTGRSITAENDPMQAMVLQRIRQLAAHETGHTLGLSHNFAASAFSQSASVMDYPHPYITLGKDGIPDLSHAYAVNIGQWDKVAIDYGYRQFGARFNEKTELNKILDASEKTGLIYITDEDARPFSGAHPHAHLWDNGADPADELTRILEIRKAALARFNENAIKPGTPMAQLEDTLVPLYLLHRYQTEAAIKEIGGLDYRYSLRGDGQPLPQIVPLADQNKAIAAVLKTLTPDTLTLPESLLKILPPRPPALPRTRESFPSETGLTFDPIAAAETAPDLTLQVLLDPARASRIVQYHMREHPGPSLRVLLEQINKTTAERPEGGHTISSEVERAVEFRALEAMFTLALNPAASSQARAIARSHIEDIYKQWTTEPPPADSAEAIHRKALIHRIDEFHGDPTKFTPAKPIEAPPGMPIGDDEDF
jgi:hypothetical protein